ncbi:hypothetical protein [uncultured Bacteroides sp.]|uniref:hypothetical protein n=1 Tax=uncultured Bacteroides sp. TaxID=162156 RepID=UPI0025D73BD5|nr:hypothetical protein [uncultured Bacteroides sp.]
MSDSIIIKSRAIPANSRSKNYRTGGVIQTTGGGGSGSSSSGSGSGDVGLSKDIRVNAPKTGHLDTGEILRQGMGYEQIFRKMLYAPTPATLVGKLSTANDVEFGSTKGTITYTATRNDSGAMVKSFYDDKEENVLAFTGDAAGVQTVTRKLEGNYTKGETYTATVVYGASEEITEMILTNRISVNVKRKWFAGVCSSIPTTSADVRALASSGLYNGPDTYKFPSGSWRIVAVCIPADNMKEI